MKDFCESCGCDEGCDYCSCDPSDCPRESAVSEEFSAALRACYPEADWDNHDRHVKAEAEFRRLGITPQAADPNETRVINPVTGGAKGSKPCQPGWLPPAGLWALGEVAGYGAGKYSPTNFRKGFAWSLSLNACWRHLLQMQGGEWLDGESGQPHAALAAWHLLNLIQLHKDHPQLNDLHGGPAEKD